MSGNGGKQSVCASLFMSRRELKSILEENSRVIAKANRDELCLASAVATALIGVLFVTAIILSWKDYIWVYGTFAVCFGTVFLVSRFGFQRVSGYKGVLALAYAFMLLLFAFSMMLSFYTQPKGSMVCFVVMLIVTPMLTIDRARNVIALYLVADAAFLTGVCLNLEGKSAMDCTVNCIAFTISGFLLGRYICMMRLRAIDAERRLGMLIRCDSLTGLGNRRKLFELLASIEDKGRLTGVIMIDIDHFKEYNDTLGHQAGDECLARLGELFERLCAKRGFEAFRYGGEEFIAVSTIADADTAGTAEDIVRSVRELGIDYPAGGEGVITISAGYAANEHGGYEQYISHADAALYRAKLNGRNNAVQYTPADETLQIRNAAPSFRKNARNGNK